MEYTDANGNGYDLATLDSSLYAKQQAADEAKDTATKAKLAWAFLKAALPDDSMSEVFGTADQRKASVPQLLSVFEGVKSAYWADYDDARLDSMERQISSLGSLPDIIAALSKLK